MFEIIHPVITLAVCIFLCCTVSFSKADECTKIDNCSCKFTNGSVIDISSLGWTDGRPRFNYEKALGAGGNDDGTGFKYAFNPCYGFNDTWKCDNVVGCQMGNSSDGQGSIFFYPIGSADTATFIKDGTSITYKSADPLDGITRTSTLLLSCDLGVKRKHPKFYRLGECSAATPSNAEYEFLLVSECACAGVCSAARYGNRT